MKNIKTCLVSFRDAKGFKHKTRMMFSLELLTFWDVLFNFKVNEKKIDELAASIILEEYLKNLSFR